jgi:hypothetical protein
MQTDFNDFVDKHLPSTAKGKLPQYHPRHCNPVAESLAPLQLAP